MVLRSLGAIGCWSGSAIGYCETSSLAMAMKAMKAIQELEDTDKGTMEDTDRFLAWWRRWNRELERVEAEEQAARYLEASSPWSSTATKAIQCDGSDLPFDTEERICGACWIDGVRHRGAAVGKNRKATRAMKAKTAMKTMSTRAMKAKKAKTALKTMSKKAMQAMKAKKVGRKSLVPAGTKVKTTGGLKKQDDPLGPIDFALSIHEDRHDKAPEVQVRDDRKGVRRLRPSPTSHKERS